MIYNLLASKNNMICLHWSEMLLTWQESWYDQNVRLQICIYWMAKIWPIQIQLYKMIFDPPGFELMNSRSRQYVISCHWDACSNHLVISDFTTYNRITTHPKFNPTGVRTHGLPIMTVHFMSLRCLNIVKYARKSSWGRRKISSYSE